MLHWTSCSKVNKRISRVIATVTSHTPSLQFSKDRAMSTLYWIAYHTAPLSQHFALTEKSSVNAGLGEGLVGSFPEMYNDPNIFLPSMKSGAKTYPKAVNTLYSLLRRIFRPACRSSVLTRILWFCGPVTSGLAVSGPFKTKNGSQKFTQFKVSSWNLCNVRSTGIKSNILTYCLKNEQECIIRF